MKKIKVNLCLILIAFLLSLTSCHKVSGNQLDFNYFSSDIVFSNGVSNLDTGVGTEFSIDVNNQTLIAKSSNNYNNSNLVISGGTAPRYLIDVKEGYEGAEKYLNALHISDNDKSVIYTQGYLINGLVFGICNVYKDTVGYLSGGGNYGEEEIAYSVYFSYNNLTDEFSIIYKISNAMIVAFSNEQIIFWQNKKLYSKNINTNEVKFLCKDYSYDSGLQHQSIGNVYFNNDYVIFYFMKAKLFSDRFYSYIYNFTSGKLIKLEVINT